MSPCSDQVADLSSTRPLKIRHPAVFRLVVDSPAENPPFRRVPTKSPRWPARRRLVRWKSAISPCSYQVAAVAGLSSSRPLKIRHVAVFRPSRRGGRLVVESPAENPPCRRVSTKSPRWPACRRVARWKSAISPCSNQVAAVAGLSSTHPLNMRHVAVFRPSRRGGRLVVDSPAENPPFRRVPTKSPRWPACRRVARWKSAISPCSDQVAAVAGLSSTHPLNIRHFAVFRPSRRGGRLVVDSPAENPPCRRVPTKSTGWLTRRRLARRKLLARWKSDMNGCFDQVPLWVACRPPDWQKVRCALEAMSKPI